MACKYCGNKHKFVDVNSACYKKGVDEMIQECPDKIIDELIKDKVPMSTKGRELCDCEALRDALDVTKARNEELEKDKRILQTSLKALMGFIPEEQLHLIPDGVKFACLVSLPEYEELSNEESNGN